MIEINKYQNLKLNDLNFNNFERYYPNIFGPFGLTLLYLKEIFFKIFFNCFRNIKSSI